MALKRQGQTRIHYRQVAVQSQANGLRDVKIKLDALTAACAARRGHMGENQAVTSADETRVSALARRRCADRDLLGPTGCAAYGELVSTRIPAWSTRPPRTR
jgi:hypothetical protein